jgi:transcriptional regulator with XRE-family HTH domain
MVMVEPAVNPTVARRELAVYFRELREQHGWSLADVSALLEVGQSQASRLDSGERGFRLEDVRRLSDGYGLGAGESERLMALARDARRRAWWQTIELDKSYRELIGFEQIAESIHEFCNIVIPGLLQTEDYALALAENQGRVGAKPFVLEEAVETRMRRQEVLRRARPPALSVVVDEVVIARGVGGPEVMREQIDRLLEFADRPRTSLRVIGFESGIYPAAPSQFILLDLGGRLPAFYYAEDQRGAYSTSAEVEVNESRRLWGLLQARALTPKESRLRIASYRA